MATFIAPKFIRQTIDYDHVVYRWQPKVEIVEKSFLWWKWKERNFTHEWKEQNGGEVVRYSKTYHNDIVDFDNVSSFKPLTSRRWAMSPFDFRTYTPDKKPGDAARATYGNTWKCLTDPDSMLYLIEINMIAPNHKTFHMFYWHFESEENQVQAFQDLISQIQYRSPD